MEPKKEAGDEVVDLIDKIFEKGIILDADLFISLGGVPLVGVNLKAAIAGMTKMLDYGMMEAWDQELRQWYAEQSREEGIPIKDDEELYQKTFGSQWYKSTVYSAWRQGQLYLTDKRIFLLKKDPEPHIVFEVNLNDIKKYSIKKVDGPGTTEKGLCIKYDEDEITSLHTKNLKKLRSTMEEVINPSLRRDFNLPADLKKEKDKDSDTVTKKNSNLS